MQSTKNGALAERPPHDSKRGALSWLTGLPISLRVYALVFLWLSSLAGGLAVHLFSEGCVAQSIIHVTAAQNLSAQADEVFAKVLRLEITASQFRVDPDQAEKRFASLLKEAQAMAEATTANALRETSALGMAKTLGRFAPALVQAGTAFSAYARAVRTVGLDDSTGTRGQLVDPIRKMEDELLHWPNVESIVVSLQKVKRFEQEFLAEPLDETAGRLRKAANELDFVLFGGPFGNETKKTLSAYLASCTKALKAYLTAVNAQEAAKEDLHEAFAQLEVISNKTRTVVDDLTASITSATRATRHVVKTGVIFASVAFALLAVAVAVVIARSIYRPIQSMGAVLLDLADGHDHVDIPCLKRRDEIGVMARSMETLRSAVGEAFRLQQMVEVQPARVMLCDPDTHHITYANKAALEILGRMEPLLGCRAEDVLGRPLMEFHQNLKFLDDVLKNPLNLPHKGKFRMGNLTIEHSVNAIHDKRGRYLGAMLNWTDVSAYVQLADDFEKQVKLVAQVVGDTSGKLAESARAMAGLVDDVRRRSGATAQSVQQSQEKITIIHDTTRQLTDIIGGIERRVGEANGFVATAVDKAENAATVMTGLQQAVEQISAATHLIATIANQTNLLSLNATIEAARAGDAGKGFAVVANEVKGLATQTAQATEDIGSMIEKVEHTTQGAAIAISSVVQTIGQINALTADIASAVDQQETFTCNIAGSVNEASEEIGQMVDDMNAVMAAMGQAADAASMVHQGADDVSGQASDLDRRVTSFLKAMQA